MLTLRSTQILGVLLFLAFIVFIEIYIGWTTLLAPWGTVPPGGLVLALALILLSYALRAVRLYRYFPTLLQGRFLLCWRLMLQHNLFNNLLPMRSGELSFPLLMSRYFNVEATRSIPALLWFRFLDLHTLGLLAFPTLVWPLMGTSGTLAVACLWVTLPWLVYRWGLRVEWWLSQRTHRKLPALATRLLSGLPRDDRAFAESWWWSVINWVVKLGVFAWVLQLFIPIAPQAALLGAIGGELTSVLPIHGVAGMGTYEAGIMAALLPLGIETREALEAAVNLHLFMLAASLGGGMLTWLLPYRKQATQELDANPPTREDTGNGAGQSSKKRS